MLKNIVDAASKNKVNGIKSKWQDSEFREKQLRLIKARWQDPKYRGMWQEPEYKNAAAQRATDQWQDRFQNFEDFWGWVSQFPEEKQKQILMAMNAKAISKARANQQINTV